MNTDAVDGPEKFVEVVGVRDSKNFLLLPKLGNKKSFEQPNYFIVVLWLVQFYMLNDADCSRNSEASQHVQNHVPSFIEGLALDVRIQVHALSVSRLAGQNWANDIGAFGQVHQLTDVS